MKVSSPTFILRNHDHLDSLLLLGFTSPSESVEADTSDVLMRVVSGLIFMLNKDVCKFQYNQKCQVRPNGELQKLSTLKCSIHYIVQYPIE